MPSQWKRRSPFVEWYYNCCKDCHPTAFFPDHDAIHSQWFVIDGTLAQVKNEPVVCYFLRRFISDWMERLPRRVRKELSYHGCLEHDDGVSFDPGNWVYYLAMKFLLPELLDTQDWNDEKVGDIWESLLAAKEDGGFAKWMRRCLKECVGFFKLVPPDKLDRIQYSHGHRITFALFQDWLWTEGLLEGPDGTWWT